MIRFDDAARTLSLAVRDLEGAGQPRGDLGLSMVRSARTRMADGQRIHRTYQQDREEGDDGFASEVTLRHRRVVEGWTVTLQGRVDGLTELAGRWIVEEVKSTALDASRLHATRAADWPAYVEQLEHYLLLVAIERPAHAVSGRLVLISLADGSRHALGVALERERVEARVLATLTELIVERERRLAWLTSRRAKRLSWPHPTRRVGQERIEAAVDEALTLGRPVFVSAPTGLGKTDAVLQAALRVALRSDRQVFWATSRTTQQPAVLAAVRRLADASGGLGAVTLGARAGLCLRRDAEGAVQIDCRPEACRYAEGYFDKVRDASLRARFAPDRLGRTELLDLGEAHTVCPHQLARELVATADVVVGDINYVLDPGSRLRGHFDNDAAGWIVVVDEAHQLVERARGYLSPALEAAAADAAVTHLEALGRGFEAFAAAAREVRHAIGRHARAVAGAARDDEAVVALPADAFAALADEIDALGIDYALRVERYGGVGPDDPWLSLARAVLRFDEVLSRLDESAVVLGRATPGRERVRVCNLDPSAWVGPRLRALGGLVAVSATLRPLDFHIDLLGLADASPSSVEVDSPFPPERLRVLVASRVSTAYRDRIAHAPATAALLERCVRAVPGNVAVFFSSFAMLDDLTSRWELPGHDLLLQPPGLSEHEREVWLRRLQSPSRPVVLAAVLGGLFAEGIDLPAGALDAVLVCGPAFPPVGLERDLLRARFEERYGAGFLYASLVPGMTKVVQAAGRLIRRPEDRGAVVLVGRRFRWRDVSALLPPAWEPRLVDHAERDLAAFFSEIG